MRWQADDSLARNEVPEWSAHYLNYKALKKQIKSALQPGVKDASHDLTGWPLPNILKVAFFYELDRNVESVDDFFNKKSTDMQRRLKLLIDQYGDSQGNQLDFHELEDLVCFLRIKLTTGRRFNGFAFANAEIIGTHPWNVLIAVVCRRKQAWLHENSQKVFSLCG